MPYVGFYSAGTRADAGEVVTDPQWTAHGSERTTATWVSTPDGKRVCTMRPNEDDWNRAQLIAAAPDMLAALRQCLPLLRAHLASSSEGAATICVVKAALDKAGGRA